MEEYVFFKTKDPTAIRLMKDHLIVKIGEVKVNRGYKAIYRKTGVAML